MPCCGATVFNSVLGSLEPCGMRIKGIKVVPATTHGKAVLEALALGTRGVSRMPMTRSVDCFTQHQARLPRISCDESAVLRCQVAQRTILYLKCIIWEDIIQV